MTSKGSYITGKSPGQIMDNHKSSSVVVWVALGDSLGVLVIFLSCDKSL